MVRSKDRNNGNTTMLQKTQKANRTIVGTETKINDPNTCLTAHLLGHFNKCGGVQVVL